MIDRDTASRFGNTTKMIDDTLYDAFGQRHVSTIIRQLNQYRVVMEVAPQFGQNPNALKTCTSIRPRHQVPLSVFTLL